MSRTGPTERLFLALWPSAAAVDHLESALAPIQRDAPAWLRWQQPHRWHITLCFLGDVPTRHRAERAAAIAAAKARPAAVRLAGAGTFGPVLWIGVDTGGWLTHVAKGLLDRLTPQDRRFRPHVTVGRARHHRLDPTAVGALTGYRGPSWLPTDLTLVRSTIGPAPAYEVVGTWPLGAGDQAGGFSKTV